MKLTNKIIPVVSLMLGLSVGICGVSYFEEKEEFGGNVQNAMAVNENAIEYEINSVGKTYGSAIFASNEQELPDLISAVGNNGIEGYIRKSDFIDKQPETPEEAVKYMEEKRKRESKGVYGTDIPLYDVDGITIVDTFTLGGDENTAEFYYIDKNGNKVITE